MAMRHPTENKERGAHVAASEQLQHAMRVRHDATGQILPIGSSDAAGESTDMEIILHVNGKGIKHAAIPSTKESFSCPVRLVESSAGAHRIDDFAVIVRELSRPLGEMLGMSRNVHRGAHPYYAIGPRSGDSDQWSERRQKQA